MPITLLGAGPTFSSLTQQQFLLAESGTTITSEGGSPIITGPLFISDGPLSREWRDPVQLMFEFP